MFNLYLVTQLIQKEEYKILKKEVAKTPLEKSIDSNIEKINHNIEKITKLNQIECIY